MKFRVHHILCTTMLLGDEGKLFFTDHMLRIINTLKEMPDQKVILIAGVDGVCAVCPKLDHNGHCMNEEVYGELDARDNALMEALGVKAGKFYTYGELVKIVEERLTREMFEEHCGVCGCFKKDICTYDKLVENICDFNRS